IVRTAGGMDDRVPSVREMLERPCARGALGDHHVAGFDGVQDAAATEDRVGGFVRIVVTFDDVALDVFELPADVDFELGPGRWRDDHGRLWPVQRHVASGEPMSPMDGPGRVPSVRPKGVLWALAEAGILGEDVPGIPFDTLLASDRVVSS